MGIYVAAAAATLLALIAVGLIVRQTTLPRHRLLACAVILALLPLQPLVFYAVRLPVLGALEGASVGNEMLFVARFLAAPLTEEPAKWLILIVAAVRLAVKSGSAPGLAMAAGLGFGIGEIWFLAEQFSRIPEIQAAPAMQFWGFVVERALVCVLHGLFVVPLFYAVAGRLHIGVAALIGVVLHGMTNAPILAIHANLFGWGPAVWGLFALVWPMVLVAIGIYLLLRHARSEAEVKSESAAAHD